MILKYSESYMLFLAIVYRNGLGLHLPSQKTVRCTLGTVAAAIEEHGIRPPSLFIVGSVVDLTLIHFQYDDADRNLFHCLGCL